MKNLRYFIMFIGIGLLLGYIPNVLAKETSSDDFTSYKRKLCLKG